MTALDHNPSTLNFLPALDFKLIIKRCPHVEFFCQKINLPGMTGESAPVNIPFATIKRNYDHLNFHPLTVSFKIDEDFINYMEIHNWMRALGSPKDTIGYKQLKQNAEYSGIGLYSELSVMFLDSKKNPKIEVTYLDAFPTDISDLYFETDAADVKYHLATVTFDYTLYTIQLL
jgi:hypothetical protein